MNLKLSDARLRQVSGELLAENPALTGRQLRAALRARFGAVCRTDRVYTLWRSLRAEQVRRWAGEGDLAELKRELSNAKQQISDLEKRLVDTEGRAVRAEERERVHQERWAREIDALRRQAGLM